MGLRSGQVRHRRPRTSRLLLGAWVAIGALVAVGLAGALIFRGSTGSNVGTPSPHAWFEPPVGDVYLGLSTERMDTGLKSWDSAAGIATHPALVGEWTTPDGPFAPILAAVISHPGITPVVHWNLPMQDGQITDGSRDAYIRAQVASVKAFRAPVFVRLDWEMNADWYPGWDLRAVNPVQYIAAWRHVVALFAGVPNVAFVWCPNVFDHTSPSGVRTPTSGWYPGDAYVSWVGLDAYPQSAPATVLLNGQDGMNQMARFAAAHHKPMMLAEWAPNTPYPDTAAPIDLVFDWAARYPATVKALLYFDFITQGKDYTLADHPVGAATFRARIVGKANFLPNVVSSSAN